MKKTIIAAATIASLSAPAFAELEGDLSLTYHSQFNYRGMNGLLETGILGGDTENTFETAINAAWKLNDQWSLVAGANIHTIPDSSADHNRFRGGVRYTTECYHLELGYQRQELDIAFTDFDTAEIYLNLGTQCPWTDADVNLYVAHDIDLLEGTYAELSAHKGWELCEKSNLGLTVGVAYSFDYWDNLLGTGNDWNHAYVTLSLAYQATENLTLTPFVTYSQGFDALEPVGATVKEDDELTFGLKASVSF